MQKWTKRAIPDVMTGIAIASVFGSVGKYFL